MKKKNVTRLLVFMCCAGMLTACVANEPIATPQSKATPVAKQEVKKEVNVYKGKIVGVSQKAKIISIKGGKKTEMVKFNDATKGMEFAKKGEAAIIKFKAMGNDKVATVVKQKLAKLPVGVTEIQPSDVAKLVAIGSQKGKYFLVDARPAGRYKAGHIPTAVSIPVAKLKETKSALLPKNKKDIQLIFYCGGATWGMSTKNASLAKKMGYENIQVLLKGAPGWKKIGKNLVATNDFVEKGNIILLDVRSRKVAAGGHINRAVNIPLADLEDAEDEFPTSKAAPVVIYGVNDQAAKAAKIIKGLGYKSVSLLDGGLIGWMEAGKKLQSGPVATEINWVRKRGKGEVSTADFEKTVAGQTLGVLIVDVRNADETTDGMFAGAVNIPLDSIEARMAELPKDKTLLLHCSTGVRATMANSALKKAGYTSKVLVASVECEEGKCEIAE